jgi:hypothetical protein
MRFEFIKRAANEFDRMKYQNRVADKIMDKVLWLDRLNQKDRASNLYKVVAKLKNKSLETVRKLHP